MASLEFTLSFPIMLLVASAVVMIGRAGVARTSAGIAARQQAWAGRPNARPSDALSLAWDVEAGAQERTPTKNYSGWVGGQRNPNARSQHTVFAGSWDFRTVKFEPNRGMFTPHYAVLGKMGGSIGGGVGQGLENTFGKFTKILETVITNKALLSSADAANFALRIQADSTLLTVLGALYPIEFAIDALDSVPFVDLSDESDVIGVMIHSVKNLREVAHERPGTWKTGKLGKIVKAFGF